MAAFVSRARIRVSLLRSTGHADNLLRLLMQSLKCTCLLWVAVKLVEISKLAEELFSNRCKTLCSINASCFLYIQSSH